MQRHIRSRFVYLAVAAWIVGCSALVYYGTAQAHITAEDDARLQAASAALIEAYNAVQEVRQEGGQVPPPPTAPDKADWQCYLDRYDDVRRNGAYTKGWATRHYANWGQRERRVWGCADDAQTPPQTGGTPLANGFVWKPVSESRGGRLVVLLPASMTRHPAISLEFDGRAEVCAYENVDGANEGRHHYWCSQPGGRYPANTVLVVGDTRYLIPVPGNRYDRVFPITQ